MKKVIIFTNKVIKSHYFLAVKAVAPLCIGKMPLFLQKVVIFTKKVIIFPKKGHYFPEKKSLKVIIFPKKVIKSHYFLVSKAVAALN